MHTPAQPPATGADRLLSVTAVPDSPGRVVVEVVGEVDTYTAPLLELCLHSQATQPGLRELIVDLERATFLGAAGMSVLAQANHRCRGRGARLVVRSGGRRTVLRPLQLAGLAEVIAPDSTEPRDAHTRGPRTPARPRPRPRRAPTWRPQRVCR
jgi:anti-sigma B factor antagonist